MVPISYNSNETSRKATFFCIFCSKIFWMYFQRMVQIQIRSGTSKLQCHKILNNSHTNILEALTSLWRGVRLAAKQQSEKEHAYQSHNNRYRYNLLIQYHCLYDLILNTLQDNICTLSYNSCTMYSTVQCTVINCMPIMPG